MNMIKRFLNWVHLFVQQHPDVWWALYLPIYLIGFFTLEHLIDGSAPYWVSWMPLDDKIPFVGGFVLAYYAWYPLLVFTGIFLIVRDGPAFRRYMQFIAIGFTLSMVICAIFPNGQDMRPTEFASENLFTQMMQAIYAADTNTNVFPSVHVVGSIAALFAYFDSDGLKKLRIPAFFLVILISASTVFVKQHSVLDILGGVALCVPIWILMRCLRRKEIRYEKEKQARQVDPCVGAGDQEE